MEKFTQQRGLSQQKIPPLHPSANPAETFMRPLGKAMKIANDSNTTEKDALRSLLSYKSQQGRTGPAVHRAQTGAPYPK